MPTKYWNSKFHKLEFRFDDFPETEFQKIDSDQKIWNWKLNWNPTSDGGSRNWNQKMGFPTLAESITLSG